MQEMIESMGEVADIKTNRDGGAYGVLADGQHAINDEAIVHLEVGPGGELSLKEIRALEKGTGAGGRTLDLVKESADILNADLHLTASAFGESGMSQEELVGWYEKNGFEIAPGQEGHPEPSMVREADTIKGMSAKVRRQGPQEAETLELSGEWATSDLSGKAKDEDDDEGGGGGSRCEDGTHRNRKSGNCEPT